MNLTCLIIEDNPIERELLLNLSKKIPLLGAIHVCSNPVEATPLMAQHKIDLILTDIDMGEVSGLEFIRSLSNPLAVIFITSFPEFALEGFDVNAIDFIVKPVTLSRLLRAVTKASELINLRQAINSKKDDHFFIRTDAQYVKLLFNDVIYIEAYGDFVKLHTSNQTHIALVNLKNIENQLPSATFIRVHRSYIVNVNHIATIDNSRALVGTYAIPIGGAYREIVHSSIVAAKLVKRSGDELSAE